MGEERSPREIAETIERLDTIVSKLRFVFEAAEREFDPFIEITYQEVKALKAELTVMLREYQYYMKAFENGELFINIDGRAVQGNPAYYRSGKGAPAYKHNLDGAAMYQMRKEGISLDEIARRFGCSPDTVKRRILEIEQRGKE